MELRKSPHLDLDKIKSGPFFSYVPAGHSDTNPHHVLLGDEALDEADGVHLHDVHREGRVLHVAVEGHDAGMAGGQLG